MANVRIVNVVATTSVDQSLDFNELTKNREILYNSNAYGGKVAYLKTKNMKGKVSFFQSGKMISVGTKSEKQAVRELKYASKFLIENGFIKKVRLKFKTQNLVVTADFENNLSLEKLSEGFKTIYEPEQFPGAIVRFNEPFKTSILIFSSGKTVITGLKSQGQIEATVKKLEELIKAIQ